MTKSTFRSDIEGLRGIAVLSVVCFHCGITAIGGGFVGVDVFFVLSGYLITGLLVKEIETTSTLNLLQFYARRARRLLPLAALVGLATLVASTLILAPAELGNAARATRATSVYLSNMFFAINASDYFAPAVKLNPMLHTWSLAVEEQFYLFWPLLIVIALQVRRSPKLLVGVLALVTAVSFALSVRLTTTSPSFAFYGLPTRAWEFGIGGLAVLIPRGRLRVSPGVWTAIGYFGLAAIVASVCLIPDGDAFPGWIASVPVIGTTLTLVAGAEHAHHGAGRVLDTKPLQFLGTMSYSWYLWHWPFLVFAAAIVPSISTAGRIGAALAALAVAVIAHRLFENPIRYQPRLVAKPWTSLALGAALMAVSLGASVASIRLADRFALAPEMRPISAAINDIADLHRDECVSYGQDSLVKACVFGDSASSTSVVLFGDSHGIQWTNPIRRMAERRGWRLTTIFKSGCPPTDVTASPGCAEWRAAAIRRIQALRPGVIIVANAMVYMGRRRQDPAGRFHISVDEWERGTRRTLTALSANGVPVLAIHDNPMPPFDVPTCLARAARHAWYPANSCQIAKSEAIYSDVFAAEDSAAVGLPGVVFLNLTQQFCEGEVCPSIKNGLIVYRDDNHLTATFAESLTPVLEARVRQALGVQP